MRWPAALLLAAYFAVLLPAVGDFRAVMGDEADPRFEVDHVDARWFGVRAFMD
jgi:hypothetical protein